MELQNFIGGKWMSNEELQTIPVVNPANGEQLAIVPLSTKSQVAEAVAAARKAQKSWALTPAPKRADFLYEIGHRLKEKKEYLAQILTKKWER